MSPFFLFPRVVLALFHNLYLDILKTDCVRVGYLCAFAQFNLAVSEHKSRHNHILCLAARIGYACGLKQLDERNVILVIA